MQPKFNVGEVVQVVGQDGSVAIPEGTIERRQFIGPLDAMTFWMITDIPIDFGWWYDVADTKAHEERLRRRPPKADPAFDWRRIGEEETA